MKLLEKNEADWAAAAAEATVLVCVPVYNGEKFILDCLRSITAQDFSDFTVLVVDNASTDGTPQICEQFDDSRFYYLRNKENVGALGNHNICLDHAISKYLKILSADDVLLPNTLRLQVAAAEADDQIALVTSNMIETDEQLTPIREVRFFEGKALSSDVIKLCARKAQNFIGGPSNTLIRSAEIGNKRFSLDKKWLSDLDFHSQIIEGKIIQNINVPGFLYRRHNSADSFVSCPPLLRLRNEAWYISKNHGPLLSYARVVYRFCKNSFKRL